MARATIPDALRQFVYERAHGRCDYCLLQEDDSFSAHTIDHIIAQKHRGSTTAGNLALACAKCNRFKGSDIATLDPLDSQLTRLFDPRRDVWADHFALVGAVIEGLTAIGRGTARVLQFNESMRVRYRSLLQAQNRYPRE